MTEKEKYEVLLGELAEKLKEKNDIISLQNYKIANLESNLKSCQEYITGKDGLKVEKR